MSLRSWSLRVLVLGLAAAPFSPTLVSASAQAAAVRAPLVATSAGVSSNWSGYASQSGRPFTSVAASWTQPKGTCGAKTTFAAFWVGIDGDGSNSVEQTGTEVDCAGGQASYFGWYEMYPKLPVSFSETVKPGDKFSASVTDIGTTFTLTLADTTRGWTKTETLSYTKAKRYSAEVIAEAPCCSAGGNPLPLTQFSTVHFTGATANGVAIGSLKAQEITMETAGGTVKAKPSSLSAGENFTITWHHN